MPRYKSPANRKYTIRLAVLMTAYLVLLFIAVRLFRSGIDLGLAAWPLAIAPALPVIGIFWAVMRLLIDEPDEYRRMLLVRQALFATGFCLTIVTVWQFLQNFELVAPGNGGFGAVFLWFIGLGLGALYNKLTVAPDACA